MGKSGIETVDKVATVGFAAIEQQRRLKDRIVELAAAVESAPVGPERVALFRPLLDVVKEYKAATAKVLAAQQELSRRAQEAR